MLNEQFLMPNAEDLSLNIPHSSLNIRDARSADYTQVERQKPSLLVDLVCLVYLVYFVSEVPFNQTNETNQTNQRNQQRYSGVFLDRQLV
jgi:hypothetical protein